MIISIAVWTFYINRLAAINQRAADLMEDWVQAHGLDDGEALVNYAESLTTRYGEAAAEMACQMYDTMAEMQGANVPAAEPAEVATFDEVARAVYGARRDAPVTVPSVIGRLVKQASADTTLKNARRDGAQFAWIPSGDACAFCDAIASRGWQDTSMDVAMGDHADHIHNNCKCEFCVRFDNESTVEGYDPQALYDEYYNADPDGNSNAKINAMRRQRYAENKEEINAQKRAAYAERQARKK